MRRLALPALLAAAALALAGCGGDGDGSADGGGTVEGAGGCRDVEAPEPRDPGALSAPEEELDPAEQHRLRFETSCGAFVVTLDTELAPRTTASLVSLAEQGYFDDTIIHRIVPGFVIQGGDPTQTGGGGPGYTTVDAPPGNARYVKGVVAMAKTPDEPPGASGSQFFVVTADDAGLPPEYAIVGTVSDGLDIVERIGELGDETEQPTRTVLVETVAVAEP